MCWACVPPRPERRALRLERFFTCRAYWFVKNDVPDCLVGCPRPVGTPVEALCCVPVSQRIKFAEVSRFVSVHNAALQRRSDE